MPSDLQPIEPQQHLAVRLVTRMRRILLASVGVLCVGLAAIGVVVPGVPTTIFLIIATACFMRSCPWLQSKLIENRFFGPFLKYLDPDAVMPKKAKVITICIMWTAITSSLIILAGQDLPFNWILAVLIVSGLAGTVMIARFGASVPKPAVVTVEA
ncbi:MAG: YbaN family protein [Phycisphaerales bacterium]